MVGVTERVGLHARAAQLALVVLTSCAPMRAPDALAPVVAIEPSGPVTSSQRTEREIPLTIDDAVGALWTSELDRFVRSFVATLTSRDPSRALRFFAADNRDAQRELGIDDDQYLAEGIGLSESQRLDGSSAEHRSDPGANVAMIERVVVQQVSREGEQWLIHGQLWLRDGRRYRLELFVMVVAPGRWAITPPLG